MPYTVDLCSYDGDLIKYYEVKLPDEFTTKSKALKALNQLLTYIKLGVFDEVWMVGDYVWLYKLWTNAPEVFFDELKSVGLLGYNFETRSFEVIKDTKQLDVKNRFNRLKIYRIISIPNFSANSLYLFLIVTSVTPATSATSLWVLLSPHRIDAT